MYVAHGCGVWAYVCGHYHSPSYMQHHHLIQQASEDLAQFLDYCTYGYMIDNVVLVVTGILHERDVHVRVHWHQGIPCMPTPTLSPHLPSHTNTGAPGQVQPTGHV